MSSIKEEQELKDRLRKIEALFAKTDVTGEKTSAEEAIKRIKRRLEESEKTEHVTEFHISHTDVWMRQLFVALCRRYNIKPYRYYRQRHTTVMIKTTETFLNQVLWPEYLDVSNALKAFLSNITTDFIQKEIHKDISEVPLVE